MERIKAHAVIGNVDTARKLLDELLIPFPVYLTSFQIPLRNGAQIQTIKDEQEKNEAIEDLLKKWKLHLAHKILNRTRGKPFHTIGIHILLKYNEQPGQHVGEQFTNKVIDILYGNLLQWARTVIIDTPQHFSILLHPVARNEKQIINIYTQQMQTVLYALQVLMEQNKCPLSSS